MNIVIYSKNRALQLELLLRSLTDFLHKIREAYNISIIYTYTNHDYYKGYYKLRELYPNVDYKNGFFRFIKEESIKQQTLEAISSKKEQTMFLMDDMVCIFKEPVFTTIIDSRNLCCISTRMHPFINYSYPMQKFLKTPINLKDCGTYMRYNQFNCGSDSCWNYPMSLDGNIFFTKDIKSCIEKVDFKNPNELEYKLSYNPIQKPDVVFFKEPLFINLPINIVQNFCKNVNGKATPCSAKLLNDKFLNGYRVKITPQLLEKSNSCHIEKQLEFEKGE